jgi:hypothetical protein
MKTISHDNKSQHEINTLNHARDVAKTLADEPISRREQLAHIRGFYIGYCTAAGYEIDWKICDEIIDLY